MAGCAKADRNRKNPQNAAYKIENRAAIHAAKKQAAHKAFHENKLYHEDVIRGLTRANRRATWLRAVSQDAAGKYSVSWKDWNKQHEE